MVAAINSFPAAYHEDYFSTSPLATAYLQSPPTGPSATALAGKLISVLGNWGAGGRKAPSTATLEKCGESLSDKILHRKLSLIAKNLSPANVGLNGNRRTINSLPKERACNLLELCLLSTLRQLSDALFTNNTNVTYPMKALLLITGAGPALDSQVRKGLRSAGFSGVDRTQFLLPSDISSADGLKLTRLPFILGQCYANNKNIFQWAASQSRYPSLTEHPGRIFDVLLFVQAQLKAPVLELADLKQPWYVS